MTALSPQREAMSSTSPMTKISEGSSESLFCGKKWSLCQEEGKEGLVRVVTLLYSVFRGVECS